MEEQAQLEARETALVNMLHQHLAPAQLQEQLPRLRDAMHRLKQSAAAEPLASADSLARMRFETNWAYVQAYWDTGNKKRTLKSIAMLIDDLLDQR
jgi:hypothetical protein